MMKRLFMFGLCAALTAGAGGLEMTEAADLKAGDDAPGFKLPGSDGKTYDLADFAGQRAVVIAWFPKAFTGG